jgi:hypothetical protein
LNSARFVLQGAWRVHGEPMLQAADATAAQAAISEAGAAAATAVGELLSLITTDFVGPADCLVGGVAALTRYAKAFGVLPAAVGLTGSVGGSDRDVELTCVLEGAVGDRGDSQSK